MKLSIRDRAFGHALFSNNPMPPVSFAKHIIWDRDSPASDKTIYTDGCIDDAPPGARLWLLEPRPNNAPLYDRVIGTNCWRSVWTHDRDVLDAMSSAHFVPFGGCWIQVPHRTIWPKSKNVSIIASHKDGTPGQRMRHEAAKLPGVEAHGGPYSTLPDKIDGLHPYRFSIAIENCKRDYFFTEKLIDCFATGTVPIYWGCPSIGNFFNLDGMIIVDSMETIRNVIPLLGPDLYEVMLPDIEDNFERARRYYLTEDWLCEQAPGLLDGLPL